MLLRLSLKTKIALATAAIVILLGVIVVTFVKTTLTRNLSIQLTKRGVTLAKSITQNTTDYLLANQYAALQIMIYDAKNGDADVEYVFVVDEHGEVTGHTFGEKFPVELKTVNRPERGQDHAIKHLSAGSKNILDIAIPIFKGDLGAVHVGISEEPIAREISKIVGVLLLSMAGVLVLGVAVASAIAAKIIRPLYQLVNVANAVGQGDLTQKAPVTTGDEIGLLSTVFNKMTHDLSQTLVSKDELKRSYDFTKTVLNSMTDAISVIDVATFCIADVNEAFLREVGMTRDAVIGRTCHEITHGRTAACEPPDDRCPVAECLSSGRQATAEHIHYKKDRTSVVEISVAPVSERSGEITQILHIARDVTDRKKAEADLAQKHEELRTLFNKVSAAKKEWESTIDATDDILVLLDSGGVIKRCNRPFRELSGKAYETLIGATWDQTTAELGLQISTLHAERSEIFHEPSNRWFETSAYRFREAGSGEKTVIAMHDVTDIKNITSALELTNAEIESRRASFESALDQISHLIHEVTMKKDFSVRFSNPDIKHCWEVMQCGKKDCPCHENTKDRCWQKVGTFCGGTVQGSFADKFANCAECPTYKIATTDPIYQIGENFNNMMHILETQHGELEHAYNNLKLAQSQITQQEKMASIGQLAAGVAHEINNPTGFIMSNLGSLQKFVEKLTEFLRIEGAAVGGLPPERIAELSQHRRTLKVDYILDDIHGLIRESLDGADRIKKIVQDLKSFSRVDEAEQKMADINAGIESTINIVWNELKYKVTLKKEYGDIPQTRCNPGQLNQVFMNMLVNAAHAIEKQGEIGIRTWAENGTISVSISDTGGGIPKDKINRIFEPFFTTKEVGKGTGLGLSIAYDIVKKHEGSIGVESEVGKGTTFTVTIPIVNT